MPELPEVETVRRGLENRLDNFQIDRIEVRRERAIASPGGSLYFIENLQGLYVGQWERRGKYLIASLHTRSPSTYLSSPKEVDGGWWGVHLRMTGHFQWHKNLSSPCSHTRVRIWNRQQEELRFVDTRSFGQMWWVPPNSWPSNIIKGLNNLGPEPFSNSFNSIYLKEKFKGSKRPIKNALLDQSVVAGVGNIYADESLFKAGISPFTPAGILSDNQLEKICINLIDVLKMSIGKGGTTFSDFRNLEGVNGDYGNAAWVYRRHNLECRKCKNKITRKKLAGRSTHWCSICQK